jgi:hypothetical protein
MFRAVPKAWSQIGYFLYRDHFGEEPSTATGFFDCVCVFAKGGCHRNRCTYKYKSSIISSKSTPFIFWGLCIISPHEDLEKDIKQKLSIVVICEIFKMTFLSQKLLIIMKMFYRIYVSSLLYIGRR